MRFLYKQITGVDEDDYDVKASTVQYTKEEAKACGYVLVGVFSSNGKLFTVEQIEKWKNSRAANEIRV